MIEVQHYLHRVRLVPENGLLRFLGDEAQDKGQDYSLDADFTNVDSYMTRIPADLDESLLAEIAWRALREYERGKHILKPLEVA